MLTFIDVKRGSCCRPVWADEALPFPLQPHDPDCMLDSEWCRSPFWQAVTARLTSMSDEHFCEEGDTHAFLKLSLWPPGSAPQAGFGAKHGTLVQLASDPVTIGCDWKMQPRVLDATGRDDCFELSVRCHAGGERCPALQCCQPLQAHTHWH